MKLAQLKKTIKNKTEYCFELDPDDWLEVIRVHVKDEEGSVILAETTDILVAKQSTKILEPNAAFIKVSRAVFDNLIKEIKNDFDFSFWYEYGTSSGMYAKELKIVSVNNNHVYFSPKDFKYEE